MGTGFVFGLQQPTTEPNNQTTNQPTNKLANQTNSQRKNPVFQGTPLFRSLQVQNGTLPAADAEPNRKEAERIAAAVSQKRLASKE